MVETTDPLFFGRVQVVKKTKDGVGPDFALGDRGLDERLLGFGNVGNFKFSLSSNKEAKLIARKLHGKVYLSVEKKIPNVTVEKNVGRHGRGPIRQGSANRKGLIRPRSLAVTLDRRMNLAPVDVEHAHGDGARRSVNQTKEG